MFYKVAIFVATLAITFILLSSNIQKTQAYRSRTYYTYYSSYSTVSLAWYIWVIVSGGIFGTIVGVIVCCFCCHRQRYKNRNSRGAIVSYNGGVTTVTGSTTTTGYPVGGQPNIVGSQPYPAQPYPPGTQPTYPTQPTYQAPPYTQQQPYPQTNAGMSPYPTEKMPEPPPYGVANNQTPAYSTAAPQYMAPAQTGAPAFTSDSRTATSGGGYTGAPAFTSDSHTATSGGGYDNQAATTND